MRAIRYPRSAQRNEVYQWNWYGNFSESYVFFSCSNFRCNIPGVAESK